MLFVISSYFVQFALLVSVFDIYFKSPVIHGMTPQTSPLEAPARRLIIMISDGLRADSLFRADNITRNNTHYIRSVIERRGTWGVSHTRAPTESRPTQIAITAGFYEDPSAIAKGWKENVVEFDSVFNESRYTWCWGDSKVLRKITKGASEKHVYIDSYRLQDLSVNKSTSVFDSWVFRNVEKFLNSAEIDTLLNEKLHQDKILFYLHLNGLDSAGHTYKPYSVKYKNSLGVLDSQIKELEDVVEQFYYYDKRTAYLLTGDHGMTDWGKHGTDFKNEIETPLVAWGAGVNGPRSRTGTNNPSTPTSWNLEHLAQSDVSQVDIAPLIASLIGIPIPINSMGQLPRDYFSVSEYKMSELMFSNARQMVAQYNRKLEVTKIDSLSWLYKKFFSPSGTIESELIDQIHSNIASRRYNESIAMSEDLISLSLLRLHNFQYYYQCCLLTFITFAFLGWIAWLFQSLVHGANNYRRNLSVLDVQQTVVSQCKLLNLVNFQICVGSYKINIVFFILAVLTFVLIFILSLPPQFYIYCLLPVLLWWLVAHQHATVINVMPRIRNEITLHRLLLLFIFYIIHIEILVMSFFSRFFLSIGMLSLAAWPIISPLAQSVHISLLAGWLSSCLFLAVFPLLPVVGEEPNTELVALSGCLFLLLATYSAWRLERCTICVKNRLQSHCVVIVQLIMLPLAIGNLLSTAISLKNNQELLQINQIISWTMLGISFSLPLLSSQQALLRLHSVCLSQIVPYLLLSNNHEVLFFLALSMNMFYWMLLEYHSVGSTKTKLLHFTFGSTNNKEVFKNSLSSTDFRRAYFFLFYIVLCFFGVHNIASINSFYSTWVRCFLKEFSLFTKTLLIAWKLMIPFLIVTCTFCTVNIIVQAATKQLFIIVLIFSDVIGLHFLHLVTNHGTWLDIGTSLSNYIILQTAVPVLILLYSLAHILTSVSLWSMLEADDNSRGSRIKNSMIRLCCRIGGLFSKKLSLLIRDFDA